MKTYTALLRKEKDSCYGVDFPDFPGCISSGDTEEQAHTNALAALDLHVQGMIEDGTPMPEPLPLLVIMRNPKSREGLVRVLRVPFLHKNT